MKTRKINRETIRQILKDVEIPESYQKFLTPEDRALIQYAFAGLNINELANIFKTRNRNMKTELVWRLIELGQKLAYITLFEDNVFLNWSKANEPGHSYIEGFMDCKTQAKGVIEHGLRKKSGRKTK